MLGYEVTRRWGGEGLPDDTIRAPLHGLGRAELRRLRPSRHHLRARGRRQRLLGQGTLGRPADRVPAARRHVRARGQHHDRQRRALRRHRRRGLRARGGRRAVLRAQQRRPRRRGGHRRPRLRVHDRRARGGHRQDRAATSRRGCRAASPTCSTWTATSRAAATCGMVDLEALRTRPTTSSWCATSSAPRRRDTGSSVRRRVLLALVGRLQPRFVRVMPQGLQARAGRPRLTRGPRGASPRSPSWWADQEAVGKVTGFLEIQRKKSPDPPGRRSGFATGSEVYLPYPEADLKKQAARCMDCGVPFCHQGCPLGNIIPDWNDLVYATGGATPSSGCMRPTTSRSGRAGCARRPARARASWASTTTPSPSRPSRSRSSSARSSRAGSCPRPPAVRTGKKVAVVGSGPAGLAAADQLNRAGHAVTVFERSDRIGGLLRYGIPEFKMEKRFLDRRLAAHGEGGRRLPDRRRRRRRGAPSTRAPAGRSTRSCSPAAPAPPRDLPVPGRELSGIHFAMEYLTLQNKRCEGDTVPDERVHHRGGQARGDHRRRRHRRRLPGHGPPAGRGVRAPVRAAAPPARHARAREPVAAVAERLPRVVRPRRRGRARVRGLHPALRRRRRRPGRAAARGQGRHGARGRASGVPAALPGSEFTLAGRSGPARHGLPGPGAAGPGRGAGAGAHRARQRLARRELDDERARRVHVRRHAARPVPDRVGHRRGTLRRPRRRPLPDGRVETCPLRCP